MACELETDLSHNEETVSPNVAPFNKTKSRQWNRKEKIGQGAQGCIYRCEEAQTRKCLALKVVNTSRWSEDDVHRVKQILGQLKAQSNRNLVRIYKIIEKLNSKKSKTKKLYTYMEHLDGGSLSSHLEALTMPQLKHCVRRMLTAVESLHQSHIIHRDLKCANFFIDQQRHNIKLGDFDSAIMCGNQEKEYKLEGTPQWMAPEVAKGELLDVEDSFQDWKQAEVWSLGCCVLEMLTKQKPWSQYKSLEPIAILYKLVKTDEVPEVPSSLSENAKDFICLCLQRNPLARPTITQLLHHPFLSLSEEQTSSSIGEDTTLVDTTKDSSTIFASTTQDVVPEMNEKMLAPLLCHVRDLSLNTRVTSKLRKPQPTLLPRLSKDEQHRDIKSLKTNKEKLASRRVKESGNQVSSLHSEPDRSSKMRKLQLPPLSISSGTITNKV